MSNPFAALPAIGTVVNRPNGKHKLLRKNGPILSGYRWQSYASYRTSDNPIYYSVRIILLNNKMQYRSIISGDRPAPTDDTHETIIYDYLISPKLDYLHGETYKKQFKTDSKMSKPETSVLFV